MAEADEPVRLGKRRTRPPALFSDLQAEIEAQPKKTRRKIPAHEKVKPRKNAKVGKLRKALEEMPVEILLHILAMCGTSTLTRLTRTSKLFRGILLDKANRVVWKDAFAEEGLPELTGSLSEPRVSALIWDKQCAYCGLQKVNRIDFHVQKRICDGCTRYRLDNGMHFYSPTVPPFVREAALHFHSEATDETLYLLESEEEMARVWRELTPDAVAELASILPEHPDNILASLSYENQREVMFRLFAKRKIEENERWYADAELLTEWYADHTIECSLQKDQKRELRIARIREKLKEDYGLDDSQVNGVFTHIPHALYRKVVLQPYPLTDRVWRKAGPLLYDAYTAARDAILARGNLYTGPAAQVTYVDSHMSTIDEGDPTVVVARTTSIDDEVDRILRDLEAEEAEREAALEREALERQLEQEREDAWMESVVDDFQRLSTL